MLRIGIALAWLASVNAQNVAHGTAADASPFAVCGTGHAIDLPKLPSGKRPERDCATACHALCKRSDLPEDGEES